MKTSILLIAILTASFGGYFIWASVGPRNSALTEAKQEFILVHPAFAESVAASTTFLNQEAGITLWLNATASAPLDTKAAMNAMVNIEINTSDYVLGSLSDNGNIASSDDYPHCFVHKSGWIVVYYLKPNTQNPDNTGWLGKIIDWGQYSNNNLNGNFLSEGMYYMAQTILGLSTTGEQYFHFQYPSATKLLIAIKHARDPPQGVVINPATFNIKIPNTIATLYEISWSCYYSDFRYGYTFKVDASTISAIPGSIFHSYLNRYYGDIPDSVFSRDVPHTVSILAGNSFLNGNDAYVCLLLLY